MNTETTEISDADPDDRAARVAAKRIVQALLFASDRPVSAVELAGRVEGAVDISALITEIQDDITGWGFELVEVAGGYMFRTAADLSFLLREEVESQRKLSRAAVETLAIIAYHQPVTRAEIESIRGVSISKGTLDVLLEAGWIRLTGRKRTPGRPVTYGTSDAFLAHFGLGELGDLPGLQDLQAAGLLDSVDEALEAVEAAQSENEDGQIDLEDIIEDATRAAVGDAGQNAVTESVAGEPPISDGAVEDDL